MPRPSLHRATSSPLSYAAQPLQVRVTPGPGRHVSCENCRKRKMRCSRTVNCTSCSMRGEVCVWTDAAPSRTPGEVDLEAAREEIRQLHQTIQVLSERIQALEGGHSPPGSYPQLPSPEVSDAGSASLETYDPSSFPSYSPFTSHQSLSSYPQTIRHPYANSSMHQSTSHHRIAPAPQQGGWARRPPTQPHVYGEALTGGWVQDQQRSQGQEMWIEVEDGTMQRWTIP